VGVDQMQQDFEPNLGGGNDRRRLAVALLLSLRLRPSWRNSNSGRGRWPPAVVARGAY
jgi:hypothetical protein